jgi:ABC-2 type transport system ATP-binding protein
MNSGSVIETQALTRYFGKRKVVDQLTISVPRGSVFAFIGRNGSGKTTTIRMLLGLSQPTRGSSMVLGHDSRHLPPEIIARVGYMSESHTLYDSMTVRQCGTYQARFYPRWSSKVFDSVTGHFRLDPGTKTGDLSRGERAGLSLAITLAPEPELLILDDPAIGLDPVARRSLLESMIYITRDSDRTIFFSSHLLDDVERVADHIAILDRSVLRVLCPVDMFRSAIREFTLHFSDVAAVPATVPSLRGLLRVKRTGADLALTVAAPDDATQRELRQLGAVTVDENELGLNEAVVGYLGDRGEQGFFLDGAPSLTPSRGAA